MYWRDSGHELFTDDGSPGTERLLVSTVPGPDQPAWALIGGKIRTDAKIRSERTLTVWVDGSIDQFRIYPDDASCEIRLSKVELLVPPEN